MLSAGVLGRRVLLCSFGLMLCWVVVRPGVCCWDLGGVLAEACGVLHVFGGVVVGGWWCSVELVSGQSGRAMNLGRAL